MLSSMQRIMQRNLLKYSAGQHITCPKCGNIADYRAWVIWTAPSGQSGAHCANCHREILDKVHDEKPHGYLQSIGWRFDTLIDFDKPQRKPKAAPVSPQKPGKVLNSFLRKDIFKGFKRSDYCTKTDREFPVGYGIADWPMIETTEPDGTVTINYQGDAVYSALQIAEYVRRYCALNHLTV